MSRLPRILLICAFALTFSKSALSDEVTLFTQPLANTLINGNVPTSLDVGLAFCLSCLLNPESGTDIGPFGPITANAGSQTFTVGPSNPAFGPIVEALQGPSPTQPPFFEFVPFVDALDAGGDSQVLANGFGVGTVKVEATGTVESLSIVVPDISQFELIPEPFGGLWVAVGPDGKQVNVTWVAQGVHIAAEPSELALLACGMSFVAGWFALGKLRRRTRRHGLA